MKTKNKFFKSLLYIMFSLLLFSPYISIASNTNLKSYIKISKPEPNTPNTIDNNGNNTTNTNNNGTTNNGTNNNSANNTTPNNSFKDYSYGGSSGNNGNGNTNGTNGNTNGTDNQNDKGKEFGEIGKTLADLINTLFNEVVKALMTALKNISGILLALVVVLASLDVLFLFLTNASGNNIMQVFSGAIPRYVSYGVVITLLKPIGEKKIPLYLDLTIGDFTPSVLAKKGGLKSIMGGFIKLAEGFFLDSKGEKTLVNFANPGNVVISLLAVPFDLISQGYNGEAFLTSVLLIVIGITLLYFMVQLSGLIIMAMVEYIFVVGMSAMYLPFLVNGTTASVGSKVITNILNKGVGLTIQLGLIGVAVTIISQNFQGQTEGIGITRAFEIILIVSLSVYVAGKGSSIAQSIMTGEGSGLSANEVVNRGLKNAIKGVAIALGLGTFIGKGARKVGKISGLIKKDNAREKAKKDLQSANKQRKSSEEEYEKQKGNVLSKKQSKKYGRDLDSLTDNTTQLRELNARGVDLEDKKQNAIKRYGEDSIQVKKINQEIEANNIDKTSILKENDKLYSKLQGATNLSKETIEKNVSNLADISYDIKENRNIENEAKEKYKDAVIDERNNSLSSKIFATTTSTAQTVSKVLTGSDNSRDLDSFVRNENNYRKSKLEKETENYANNVGNNKIKDGAKKVAKTTGTLFVKLTTGNF